MTKKTECTREGCEPSQTGKCLEGFDPLQSCPYLAGHDDSEDADAPLPELSFVDLPKGEALTDLDASKVTRDEETRLVVIAGPSESGKTTILTSLFESLQAAPFGGLVFAGSSTLVGFERRCHDSRIASNRLIPHTEHTRVTDHDELLHLRLKDPRSERMRPWSLLISDISGERFRTMRDSTAAVQRTALLSRVDHLCIVLDGEKLTQENRRHSAYSDSRMLLRSLIEAKALSSTCQLNILFTKWDLVSRLEESSILDFIGGIRSTFERMAEAANLRIRFFEIAARPEIEGVPFAFGLPSLLRAWRDQPVSHPRHKIFVPADPSGIDGSTGFVNAVFDSLGFEERYDVRSV